MLSFDCDDVAFNGLASWLLGALRSPNTFLGADAGLVDLVLASNASIAMSIFSSRMTSEDAAFEDAFVVRVERVERVAFLTGIMMVDDGSLAIGPKHEVPILSARFVRAGMATSWKVMKSRSRGSVRSDTR